MKNLVTVNVAVVVSYMTDILETDPENLLENYSGNLLDALEDLYDLESLVTKEIETRRSQS